MTILGIETSCDETAVAVVKDGVLEISSSIATSSDMHEKTGGVVPEVAARKQVESIVPVLEDCLVKKNLSKEDIDYLAVTVGPGLIGSLVVGVEAAKALSLAWGKSLIPVNHLVGHIYGNFIGQQTPNELLPNISLVVSGGHTDLIHMKSHDELIYLGGTIDDAAGEAFDKTARLLNIKKYLGGAQLSQIAATCKTNTLNKVLPRPLINAPNYDFSFSGLKTAVRHLVEVQNPPQDVVAYEFESAVVEVLVEKTIRATKDLGLKTILLGGGVSANQRLRKDMQDSANKEGIKVYYPPLSLCGDNAIYIASRAYFKMQSGYKVPNLNTVLADPGLGIMDKV